MFSALPDALRDAVLSQQLEAQRVDYARRFSVENDHILWIEDERVGRLWVEPRQTELYVVDVCLVPEWRGRGLGTQLLRSLQAGAQDAGRSIGLRVERDNPALRLYDRLEFTLVADEGAYLALRWIGARGAH